MLGRDDLVHVDRGEERARQRRVLDNRYAVLLGDLADAESDVEYAVPTTAGIRLDPVVTDRAPAPATVSVQERLAETPLASTRASV